MIISILEKRAGFFSQLFFLVNHYLTAKKYNFQFCVESKNWLFKYNVGWEDYFKNIDFHNGKNEVPQCFTHYQTISEFSLNEYKSAIQEIYVYNNYVNTQIKQKTQQLALKDGYDAIFIRRGDKLSSESNYIPSSTYIEMLLNINPDSHTIFLQTDDYNSYLELTKYKSDHNLNINIITLCDASNKGGFVVFENNKKLIVQQGLTHNINQTYVSSVIDNLLHTRAIDKMNNTEIHDHTINMIIGLDIVLRSNICICEYSSNVSKFIKLAHNITKNVHDVLNPKIDVDMNRTECPAFGFLR